MSDDPKSERSPLDAFVSTVAHDLRSPLATIHLSAALIVQDAPSGPSGERINFRVGVIQRQVSSMIRMISSLLDAERIKIGKLPIVKTEVDAVQDLLEILDEFLAIAGSREVLLDVILPERPLPAFYDRDRIRQVLGNLVGNALKFAKKRSTCSVLVKPGDSDSLRFEVFNVGDVIPEDKRKIIFDRFEQASPSQEYSTTFSSGLGLWIARWIVEAHGGSIWVQPESKDHEEGNLFCFTLPRYQ